jgi:hypothetical protein
MQAADSFCGMPKFRITIAPRNADAKKSWIRINGSLSDACYRMLKPLRIYPDKQALF